MPTKNKKSIAFAIAAIVVLGDIFIWQEIFATGGVGGLGLASAPASSARDYFLNVGQGDSELVIFPGNIKMMTDAGPDDSVLAALARAVPSGDDYIDLAIISQPQPADFNGYNFTLDHYRVGAFIYNGRDDDVSSGGGSGASQWSELKAKIRAKGIPLITLDAGDKISIGDSDTSDEIDFLSPSPTFAQSVALADTGLVELIKTPAFRTLFTSDIGANVEDWLVEQGKIAGDADIRADVLKIADHDSQYSSGDAFLRAVAPSVAVIETGVGAKVGTKTGTKSQVGSSTLARLASDTTALILRTDEDGTVEVYPDGNGKLKVVKEK